MGKRITACPTTVIGWRSKYFFDGSLGPTVITDSDQVSTAIVCKSFHTWEMAPKGVISESSKPA